MSQPPLVVVELTTDVNSTVEHLQELGEHTAAISRHGYEMLQASCTHVSLVPRPLWHHAIDEPTALHA